MDLRIRWVQMRDIKVTLSSAPSRVPSIEEERDWLREQGQLWYPLHAGRPRFVTEGKSWIYFIRDGKLVARARVRKLEPPTLKRKVSYTGEPQASHAWSAKITEMQLAKRPRRAHSGFQGFRYVRREERAKLERAFART